MISRYSRFAVLLSGLALLAGCGGGGGGSSNAPAAGKVFSTYQAADIVIGANDMVSLGTTYSANTYGNPAVAPNGKLYVPDYGNNTIRVYSNVPSSNGAVEDFTITTPGTAGPLNGPQTILFYGGKMLLVDYFNSRVLIWNTPPTANGVAPDVVVGQATLSGTAAACGPAGLNQPESISVVAGNLVVGDSNNHRVMIYDGIPAGNGTSAVAVLGQSDFSTCTYNSSNAAQGLKYPTDIAFDGQKMLVLDAENNRVLMWNTTDPRTLTTNNPSADIVLGQANLSSVAINAGQTAANGFSYPNFMSLNGGRLAVSDYNNNRVLIWDSVPSCSGAHCAAVFGSPVVIGQTNNSNSYIWADPPAGTSAGVSPSAKGLSHPAGVVFTSRDQLIVNDQGGSRYLVMNAH